MNLRQPDVTGDVWSEIVTLNGAETVWSYLDGPAAGLPAVDTPSI